MPLFVLRIAEGGAADLDGRLRVGLNELCHKKTCLWGLRSGLTQMGLDSHRRWLKT